MADLFTFKAESPVQPANQPGVMRIFVLLLSAALLPTLLLFTFNYFIDRYSVFHSDRGYSPASNMNYVRMEYLLREGSAHRVLVLGSSRSQALLAHERIDKTAYTFPSPGGRIHHHAENLRTLLENGVVPELVLLGVGEAVIKIPPVISLDHTLNGRLHPRVSGIHPARFFMSYLAFLPQQSHFQHLQHVVGDTAQRQGLPANAELARTGRYYCFECQEAALSVPEDEHAARLTDMMNVQRTRNTAESAASTVQEIKELAEQYGFELFVFVDPIYQEKYLQDDFKAYTEFKRLLAGISPYLDFNNLNPAFATPRNFTDVIHYGTETGGVLVADMQKAMNGEFADLELGVWVTVDNVDGYLREQTEQYNQLRESLDQVSEK